LKLRLHPRRKESRSQMIGLESVQPSRSTAVLKGKRKKQTSILVDNIPETSDLERQETFSTCRTGARNSAAEDQPKVSAPAPKRRRYVYDITAVFITIGASDFPVFRRCLVQSTILRTAATFRKLNLLPFRMFALWLVSGFHRLGFPLVIRILSGKVRCAYRYENGCITIGLCSLKLLGPLKASVLLIQSPLSIATLKAISKRMESQFWRRMQRISICIVSMFLFNDSILLIACPFKSPHPNISLPLTRSPFIAPSY